MQKSGTSTLEIERKFLVHKDALPVAASVDKIRQTYLPCDGEISVRIRQVGARYLLTLKKGLSAGVRQEYETPVGAEMGEALFRDFPHPPPISKQRLMIPLDGHTWEVDVFDGDNTGLVLAEVELEAIDQPLTLPAWVGPEVTHDPRFTNNALYRQPFSRWGVSYAELLEDCR